MKNMIIRALCFRDEKVLDGHQYKRNVWSCNNVRLILVPDDDIGANHAHSVTAQARRDASAGQRGTRITMLTHSTSIDSYQSDTGSIRSGIGTGVSETRDIVYQREHRVTVAQDGWTGWRIEERLSLSSHETDNSLDWWWTTRRRRED